MKYLYAFDIGGTSIKTALFSKMGKLIDETSYPTPHTSSNDFFESIAYFIKKDIVDKNLKLKNFLGISLCFPGPIKNNIVLKTPNLCIKDNTNVEVELQKHFSYRIKVFSANDATLAALGEFGVVGLEYNSLILYTLGTGIGGGIIVDGNLIEGTNGTAGELGHIHTSDIDIKCSCGKSGCTESICGSNAFVRLANFYLRREHERPSLLQDYEVLNIKDIFDCAKKEDPLSLKLVNLYAKNIALNMVAASLMLEPNAFFIGGGVSEAGEFLLNRIIYYFKKNARYETGKIPIHIASLGNSAGIYGAYLYFVTNL